MRISDVFPSNYIKASDLNGRSPIVTISHIEFEKIGDNQKPVVYFVGKEKGLVLNKTNANNIAMFHGDEMDDWKDKEIVLFPIMVEFQGKMVEAIRVRIPQAKDRAMRSPQTAPNRNAYAEAKAQPQAAPQQHNVMLDDEIPFAPEWR